MRWMPGGPSGDIEDRRGQRGPGFGGFGGLGGPLLGALLLNRRMGLGGILLLLLLGFLFNRFFQSGPASPGPGASPYGAASRVGGGNPESENQEVQFVSFVLDDAQKTWDRLLPQIGVPYRHAKLVLFRDYTTSGCGAAHCGCWPTPQSTDLATHTS